MALRRTLNHRLLDITKITSPSLNLTLTHSPFSSPVPPDRARTNFNRELLTSPEPGGFFRRFLHKRPISPEFLSLPIGDKLMEKLKSMNIGRDRIRLDGLSPPLSPKKDEKVSVEEVISAGDAKKLLKVAEMEKVKSALRAIPKSSISYTEFLQICKDESIAKTLDESGVVIALRDTVFLRPDQVAKAIEAVIPFSVIQRNDPRREELKMMEKEKATIDSEAVALVRKELWAGLGFLIVQTAGFMRLTFWELSWDIMEPICFYVTSMYFMAGYTFFLRTSREPSFEGFFESRFLAKQKRLMMAKKFDVERFNELQRACYPYSSEPLKTSLPTSFERQTMVCAASQ